MSRFRRHLGLIGSPSRRRKRKRTVRRLFAEHLESRILLAGDIDLSLHNASFPTDVNNDEIVTPIDALVVINALNGQDRPAVSGEGEPSGTYPDTNGDGQISPLDVLLVIDVLNRPEGEGTTTFNISAVPFDEILERPISESGATLTTLNQTTWGKIATGDEIILSNAIDGQGNVGNGRYTVTNVNGGSLTLNQAPNLVNFSGTVQVGRIITQIGTNSDFVLGIVAEDLTFGDPFAVFTDVTFDSALASVTNLDITGSPNPESPTDNFKFNSFVLGKSGDFHTTPGLIDEVGAFRPAGGGLGAGTHLAFTIDMQTGGTTGTLNLGLSAAGIIEGEDPTGLDFPSGLPAHDVLVNHSNVPICQVIRTTHLPNDTPPCTGMVMYNGASLTIAPDTPALVISGPTSLSTNEDTTLNLSGFSVDDVDSTSISVTLDATEGALSQTSFSGTPSEVTTTLNSVTYTPVANSTASDTININASAGSLSDSHAVNITINPINDPPTLVVPGQQSFFTDFDNTFSSDPAPFSIDDIDVGNSDVEVDLTIGEGTLTISPTSGVTVTPNPTGNSSSIRLTGSVANINTALANGVTYNTISPTATNATRALTVTVNDLGNTGTLDPALSGAAQVSETKTVDIEVLDFVPVDIIGQIFVDHDEDGQKDPDDPGIGGVDVILSGIDFQGNSFSMTDMTNSLGIYEFNDVKPNQPGSPYTITAEQPQFIEGGSNAAKLDLDVNGNVTVTDGSLNFDEGGFVPEFADVWRLFALSEEAPNNSAVLFGFEGGSQDWSMFIGPGWDTERYSNPRFSPSSDGNSGVLTVFDSQAGQDRTANVSTQAGTLSYRGTGSDRVYRVIGGSCLAR